VREIRQAKGGLSPQTYEELFPKNAVLQQSSGVGNCWAISALASKRQFHYFEQTMRTSITEVKVGGKVIGWEVRVPLGQSSGEIIRITFKDIAISGRSTLPVNAPAGYRILEATLAKLEARVRPNVPTHTRLGNVNLDVLKGGFGHEALEHLFGPAHEYLHIKPPSLRMSVAENIHSAEAAVAAARTPEAMIAARRELAQARGVRVEMEQYLQTFTNHRDIGTINSIRKSGGSDTVKYRIRGVDYDFHHNHAYSIQSVDRFRKTVSIVNPHNTGRPIVLTWEQAMDVFADVSGMRINANALFRKEPLRGIGRTVPHEQSAVASVRAAAERTNIAPTSTVVPSKKGITVVVPSQVETISVPRQRFIAPVIEESGTLALTGTADEMLGLLSGRKKLVVKRGGQMEQGWKIAGKDAQGNYILQKESQTMSVSTESLVRANLKPHLGSVEELQQQARIMKNMGFTRKQTRFLLENGHGLPKTMDATRLKKLQAELPAIQQAVSDIRRALGENAELSQLLEKYLLDVDHNMSVTSYLKNPKQRKVVLRELQDLTRSKRLSGEQFERIVASMQNENHPLFRLNGEELSFTGGRPRSEILREQLFAKDNTLYPVNDIPSELQRALLNKYAEKLQGDVLPQLKNQLADIVKKSGISGNDGFPAIAARAKSADGLIDKIKRMREGNAGKNPRPTYCLGDMPDAVGGRITVRNPEQLSRVMEELERTFGQGNIFEKDSFYTNAKKQNHPYRVITYTVTVNGTPCEVQLMTLSANVFADLGHNTIYKPLLPASITQAQNFDDLWRGVTARELQNINSPRRV